LLKVNQLLLFLLPFPDSSISKRLKHLKEEENFIERNGKLLGGLKAIGYFSRDNKDIDKLIKYLQLLNELSISIFVQENDQISFNTHFKHLMEVLAGTVNDSALVHKSEIQLVQELLAALRTPDRKDVVGDFSDVRDALTFFLHQSKGDESSNWIVRNFEQLDGAVLLADFSKAREYHFALLSMKNMTRNAKDELPWPLTEELFYGYDCQLESSIQACALSNKERANFLKYSLFYAAFFFRKRVTFSYIVNQNDEKQSCYDCYGIS
jgi:DNA polymerase III delta prime subunit